MEDYKDLKKWEWDYRPPDSIPVLDLLEEELRKGARIIPINGVTFKWKLEGEEGIICLGKSIKGLLVNLIMERC